MRRFGLFAALLMFLPAVFILGMITLHTIEVSSPALISIQIAPGDTLWTIAKRHYPGEHTGRMVYEIRRLNPGLDPGSLQAGQEIVIPEVANCGVLGGRFIKANPQAPLL